MKNLVMAGLLVVSCVMTGRAEDAASASYGAGVRYVDLDTRGSRGQVQEYNGKLYYIAHGDVSVSNQGSKGLIDFELKDIGSTEENGSLFVDVGNWLKMNAKIDRMTHRQNMTDFGIIVNGAFVKIPTNLSRTLFDHDLNMLFKRTESEVNLSLFDPNNSARWLSAGYWNVYKKGTAPSGYYTSSILYFAEANVDNEVNEVSIGVGHDVTDRGALSLDLIRRDFKDMALVKKFGTSATAAVRPLLPNTQLTAAEMKFRYDVGKKLALTAALTGRQRENLFNQYKMNAAVAAFNAAYKASDKLSLTARLYSRVVEIDENQAYRNVLSGTANTHEFDKLTARGELAASYRPVERLLVKAGYKMELTHRRDAPAEIFTSTMAWYSDGVFVPAGSQANSVANDDVKHTMSAGVKAELPFGIEAEANYKKLYANRAAFVNLPTRADEADIGVNVPLPGRVEFYALAQYLSERNSIALTQNHLTRNAYRAGLDWESENKVFIGADASYETSRRTTNGWFGSGRSAASAATTGYEHVAGMYNRQNSTTSGLHARVNLPRGFVVKANGSYTWSTVATPLNMQPRTDPGSYLGDITPGDVRIARGGVALEFTPDKYKNLTARASYRIDDWVDKYDSLNSGRASVAQLGASMKF